MIKKILITGCGGMLGSSVYPYLKSKGYEVMATDIDLDEDWLSQLDVRNLDEATEVALKFKPDIILHLAALTNLEYCENNKEDAHKTNYLGTRNMALISKKLNIPMVYISTAGVFDGKAERYSEEDFPNPINVYGKTKLYAEIAVQNLLEKYFIVRAGWMVGGGKKDKKFVSYMLSQIKEGRQKFKVVNDTYGTITYTLDFAKNLEKLFNTKHYGLYHMACHGDTTRHEMMKHILTLLGKDPNAIEPVSSEFFKKDFPVQRATSERMVNKNLQSKNMDNMGHWKDSLKHYIENEWAELYEKR
ncbi:MAG: SDR family oxidoreductase [Candidatus Pacearchaeota archaeon]